MIRRIGALWIKKSKKGTYLSGILNDISGDIRIAVFKNDKKEKESHPDYRIVVMTDDRQGQSEGEPSQGYFPEDKGKQESEEEEMPF